MLRLQDVQYIWKMVLSFLDTVYLNGHVVRPSSAVQKIGNVTIKLFFLLLVHACKKSRGVAPNTWSILSYPESWQNSKNVFPNSSNIALAGISKNRIDTET